MTAPSRSKFRFSAMTLALQVSNVSFEVADLSFRKRGILLKSCDPPQETVRRSQQVCNGISQLLYLKLKLFFFQPRSPKNGVGIQELIGKDWSAAMLRLDQKRAGRTLDGRTWDQMPGDAE